MDRRYLDKGDIVKFIGADGEVGYTRVISFQADNYELCAVLELQSGSKKGFAGLVPTRKIVWNGKFFEADMRKEDDD